MNDPDITVDILLATYNGGRFLRKLIESLKDQTHENWRLWVRDDGSTDESLAILEDERSGDDRIRPIISGGENLGAKSCFSWLAANVAEDSRYIMFCDQDDIWHADKISRTLSRMLEVEAGVTEKPVLVHSDLRVVDDDLNVIYPSLWTFQGLNTRCKRVNRLMIQNNITGCTVMINRRLLDLSSPIPEDAIMHDWWIAVVCSVFGRIDTVDEALIDYRQHDFNDTGAKEYTFKTILATAIDCLRNKQDREFLGGVMVTAEQMGLFKHRYEDMLDDDTLRLIDGYAGLERLGPIARRYFLLKNNVLRQGVMRNIRLLYSV